MQLFPILKNFEGHAVLGLVVEALEHYAEGSSAEFFLNFISVLDLIFCFINIICLVVVEAVVVGRARALLGVLILACKLVLDVLPNSLVLAVEGQVVNHFEFEYLLPLVGGQVLTVVFKDLVWGHRQGLRVALRIYFLLSELLLEGILGALGVVHAHALL